MAHTETLDAQIADLRRALLGSGGGRTPLSTIAAQFMDLSDGPDLIEESRRDEAPMLRQILEAALQATCGDATLALGHFGILRYEPAALLHGTFMAGPRVGTFFWFERDGDGLVGLIGADLVSMDYLRICAAALPPGSNIVPGSSTHQ